MQTGRNAVSDSLRTKFNSGPRESLPSGARPHHGSLPWEEGEHGLEGVLSFSLFIWAWVQNWGHSVQIH